MDWNYDEEDDFFINPQSVQCSFNTYRQRTDKYGFTRYFKEYVVEKHNKDCQLMVSALIPEGNPKGFLSMKIKNTSKPSNVSCFQLQKSVNSISNASRCRTGF